MADDPQVARLERRLQRERAARKSAERIAEEQTLQLYETNRALQQQGGYLRAVLDNMADGLIVVDLDGAVTLVNRTLLRAYGLAQDKVVGSSYRDVLHRELVAAISQRDKLRADGEPLEIEIALPGDRVGLVTLGAITSDSIAGEPPPVLGHLVIVRDVTTAKEIDRMKTDFISNVSHELRTPLTSILGFTKIIKRTLDKKLFPLISESADPKTKKAVGRVEGNLDIIISEGDRLTTLINEVLDVAKMEAGSVNWNMSELSVAEIVERVAASTTSLFEGRPLELRCDVEAELPAIEGDRDRLIQVLINLVSNAAKFTDQGEVVCSARREGEEIVVSVRDTGAGIAQDELHQVFEKFKQVGDTLTDKPKGTGLGLPISKQIVQHHGGRIWVESELGVGSTFIFTLPVMAQPELEQAEGDRRHGRESPDVVHLMQRLGGQSADDELLDEGRRKTVLVVDDEANIREYLKQELESGGYAVSEARDGLEAIALAKALKPDLVILDVMMPKMNGFDAAAVLKNDPQTSRIPIMIHSIVEDRERGFRLGIDRYLTKPTETATLLSEVATLTVHSDSGKTILVVAEGESVTPELRRTLERAGEHVIETCSGEQCFERARALRPDIIIIDASVVGQHAIVKKLRAAKEMEDVSLFLLAEENGAGDERDAR
ncbi:MAG: response regulator [Myxococcales bacterium]|nr:response regulator [Myxococcales bacterium]